MIAAVYDQYLDTLGGGERYAVSFALTLKEFGFEVDLFWDDPEIKEKLQNRFGINLEGINILPNIFSNRNFMGTGSFLKNYEVVFMVSDGSIPFMTGEKNILHFQVPFKDVGGRKLVNKLKLRSINHVVCNSNFTKSFIDSEFNVNSLVVYPPIDTNGFISGKKENLILNVGRFSLLLQNKRQDLLVESFKQLCNQGVKNWKLVLAGGNDVGRTSSLDDLKKSCESYPIKIMENPNFDSLRELYASAKIFWFATGFGINEQKEPHKVEHFGMSIVEAMSAGCVPIVHPKGGVTEVITSKNQGLFWRETEDLVEQTRFLIKNPGRLQNISMGAHDRANDFSLDKFKNSIKNIVL